MKDWRIRTEPVKIFLQPPRFSKLLGGVCHTKLLILQQIGCELKGKRDFGDFLRFF